MKTILTIILACYCTGLYAANSVDLFDQNRGQQKQQAKPVKVKPPRKTKIRSKKVNFSLIGISKLGEKYVIHFKDIKGQQKSVTWYDQQKSTATKIYDDYEIDKILNRTLYLNIVKNKPCIEAPKQGISCNNKNKQMIMQLVRKKVIAPPRPTRVKRSIQKPQAKVARKKPFKWQQKK
ncbi:MAG: hypothetical protein KZQ64_03305 [gamma proteobacterium symbiont of Bathyaustriella thionipta]|nr:hypothetical protein [gamma proteobacterium symbiont of Bathyaustriella thionipta]MCU7950056.1 hypothetical protein [gamma proteobacterium symbiont of Bathyaustriella thionipta]MCU7952409.1 hypothetical protein [gamma proteobacterium symbiont of Bathyaustriella thionipta]MCU7968020.1 hypothetical protein [gamma proteobacterium symbiont of Bathyaustriella thionipta]